VFIIQPCTYTLSTVSLDPWSDLFMTGKHLHNRTLSCCVPISTAVQYGGHILSCPCDHERVFYTISRQCTMHEHVRKLRAFPLMHLLVPDSSCSWMLLSTHTLSTAVLIGSNCMWHTAKSVRKYECAAMRCTSLLL
jgi:hypothetical protein